MDPSVRSERDSQRRASETVDARDRRLARRRERQRRSRASETAHVREERDAPVATSGAGEHVVKHDHIKIVTHACNR